MFASAYERGQLLGRGAGDSEDEGDEGGGGGQQQQQQQQQQQRRVGRLTAQHFPSQQAYEEYMSSIELVPKAAFSYGRRIAGDMQDANKHKKKQKLNPEQEWKAIEKIIAEKQR